MLHYHFMAPDGPFAWNVVEAPYKAVVLIEREVSEDVRWEVSKALVATGCRYMMAWGLDCSLWDDSVDYADLERFDYGDIPPEHFVMTSWHTKDTLEEVLEFARKNATLSYDDVALTRCLVLDFSAVPREGKIQALFEMAGKDETPG